MMMGMVAMDMPVMIMNVSVVMPFLAARIAWMPVAKPAAAR